MRINKKLHEFNIMANQQQKPKFIIPRTITAGNFLKI